MQMNANVFSDLAEKTTMLSWFKDPAKFFKDIYAFEPYSYQAQVMRELASLNIRRVLVMASGGSGKTKLIACHALWLAVPLSIYLKRPVTIVVISGSQDQSKNLYNYIKEAVQNNPIIAKLVEGEPLSEVTRFNNGSSISAVPNSHKAIQGLHKDVVIIDEPSLAGDFIIQDSKRIVIKNDSLDKIILLGTPFIPPEQKIRSTLFVDMWENEELYKDWKKYHWGAKDCPNVSAESIEEARRTLPDDIFSIFWEGKPYFVGDSIITMEQLKKASVDVKTEYISNYPVYAGVDWGYRDETVLTLVQVRDNIYHVIMSEGWRREEYEDLHDRIESICKQYKVEEVFVDNSDIGENQRLDARGLPTTPVVFSKDKTRMQSKMKFLFHQGRIKIDEDMIKLKQQIRKYNWDTHFNDDRVDSLMLAINKDEEDTSEIYFKVL